MTHSSKQGFTIVEISLVVLAIAIIIGGITATSSLIGTANMRNVISEQKRYVSAMREFEDKYKMTPGDASSAETLFGAAATDNGDGDGEIGQADADQATYIRNEGQEWWLFWEHLSLAGLIDQRLASENGGVGTAFNRSNVMGTNTPRSAYKPGTWLMAFMYYDVTETSFLYADTYRHILHFGNGATDSFSLDNPVLTPQEAFEVDKKIDDGQPGSGVVRAPRNVFGGTHNNCLDQAVDTQIGALYNVAFEGDPACTIFVMVE